MSFPDREVAVRHMRVDAPTALPQPQSWINIPVNGKSSENYQGNTDSLVLWWQSNTNVIPLFVFTLSNLALHRQGSSASCLGGNIVDDDGEMFRMKNG